MPRFTFICDKHQPPTIGEVLRKKEPTFVIKCGKCGQEMKRLEQAATTRVTEVLDNGLMSKSVERPADVDRLHRERAAEDLKPKKL